MLVITEQSVFFISETERIIKAKQKRMSNIDEIGISIVDEESITDRDLEETINPPKLDAFGPVTPTTEDENEESLRKLIFLFC